MQKNLQQAIHAYQSSRLIGCSHVDLLVLAYDSAIKACNQQDGRRALSIIQALQRSLQEQEHIGLATQLNQFYNVSISLLSKRHFSETVALLSMMRDALRQ